MMRPGDLVTAHDRVHLNGTRVRIALSLFREARVHDVAINGFIASDEVGLLLAGWRIDGDDWAFVLNSGTFGWCKARNLEVLR